MAIINTVLPVGTILAVQKDSKIPEGWHICDGTNGTPLLTDNRFLMGSQPHEAGQSAGHTELQPHRHDVTCMGKKNDSADFTVSPPGGPTEITGVAHALQDAKVDNRPQYYSVVFIIRVR
jgi:hypothetical protein